MRKPMLILLLAVASCSSGNEKEPGQRNVEQCRDVIGHWAARHRDMQHSVDRNHERLRVKISMVMQAVLAELPGSGSCDYAIGADGAVADNPMQITIGSTVHRDRKDIADLLSYRTDFDLIEHNH